MHVLRRTLTALLVALCGLLAGFLAYRAAHPRAALTRIAPATAPPGAGSTAGSPEGLPTPSRPLPEAIPDARLPDLSGHSHSLRDFLGRPLIVNFWATWCEPCRREMPLLSQLQSREGNRLRVVGVAIDFQSAVEKYLQQRAVSYTVLVGEDAGLAAAQQFGMEPVLPFSVFADAQGRIVTVKIGELHSDEAKAILDAMQTLARGAATLPQVRASVAAELRRLAAARARADAAPGDPTNSAHKPANSSEN